MSDNNIDKLSITNITISREPRELPKKLLSTEPKKFESFTDSEVSAITRCT